MADQTGLSCLTEPWWLHQGHRHQLRGQGSDPGIYPVTHQRLSPGMQMKD